MSRLTGDGAKPEQLGANLGVPPPDATSNLSVSTKLLYQGVYESHSGVRFLKDGNTIRAQLGPNSIILNGLDPLLLEQARSAGTFPREIVLAFTDTVIPQLIEPIRYQLIEEIRKFNETGPDKYSWTTKATIDSVDPLEFTITGIFYSGQTVFFERTGSFTWNPAGNLTVMTDGKCHRVPVSNIVVGQQGFLSPVSNIFGGPPGLLRNVTALASLR